MCVFIALYIYSLLYEFIDACIYICICLLVYWFIDKYVYCFMCVFMYLCVGVLMYLCIRGNPQMYIYVFVLLCKPMQTTNTSS